MPYKDKEKNLKYWRDYSKTHRVQKGYNGYVSKLKWAYGLTFVEYEKLLEKQHFGCAICGRTQVENFKKRLCVDHCHATGKVRGLLCTRCNTALGQLGDTVESMTKVLNYLKHDDVDASV
jgi:hypothetical protein